MAYDVIQKQARDLQVSIDEASILLKAVRQPDYRGARGTVQKMARQATNPNAIADQMGFRSFGHFLQTAKSCNMQTWKQNPQMLEYQKRFTAWQTKTTPSGMSESVGGDGGFLIPPEYSNQLLMRVYENDLLSRTTMFPMSSNVLYVPAINEQSRADGSRFGGVVSGFVGEANTINESKPNFAQVKLELGKAMIRVRLTDEFIQDNPLTQEMYLDTIVSQELEFLLGNKIVNGSGAQEPLGILNSPSVVSVAKDASQTAGTITMANIARMWSRMHPLCHKNAVWLVDPSTIESLTQLQVGYFPVSMMPGDGATKTPLMMLFGRPILVVEFCQTVGTVGDIILADLSTVLSGSKGGMQSVMSIHAYFSTDEVAWRFTFRVDARSWWTSSLIPHNGDTTRKLSNIVTLAQRA